MRSGGQAEVLPGHHPPHANLGKGQGWSSYKEGCETFKMSVDKWWIQNVLYLVDVYNKCCECVVDLTSGVRVWWI